MAPRAQAYSPHVKRSLSSVLSILIMSAASVYLFLTLRNTISVLKIHEEELQSMRDTMQEKRITRGTRSGATTSIAPRIDALEPQLASLEKRVTTPWSASDPLAEAATLDSWNELYLQGIHTG